MKTYVVNMEKDTAKRAAIEAQLRNHPELDYQIWKATEGRKLSEDEQSRLISPLFKERYGRSASLQAAGCSLSHASIYRDIAETGTKYALILEDDAILSDNLFMDGISELLDTDEPRAVLLTSDFWYNKNSLVEQIDYNHRVYAVYYGYMTSGYLINHAAAKLLAGRLIPVQYTADAWSVFISFGLKLYGVVPHVISFPDGVGEIGSAGNNPTTFYQKTRSKLIMLYLKILWIKKYLRGYRKSNKIWR